MGNVLLEFFEFYGISFNYILVGIAVTDGGYFFKKKENGLYDENRPQLLSIIDPNDPANDVAKNSYNVMKVRDAFSHAYQVLITSNAHRDPKYLLSIIRLDPLVLDMRNRLDSMFGGHADLHLYTSDSLHARQKRDNTVYGSSNSEERRSISSLQLKDKNKASTIVISDEESPVIKRKKGTSINEPVAPSSSASDFEEEEPSAKKERSNRVSNEHGENEESYASVRLQPHEKKQHHTTREFSIRSSSTQHGSSSSNDNSRRDKDYESAGTNNNRHKDHDRGSRRYNGSHRNGDFADDYDEDDYYGQKRSSYGDQYQSQSQRRRTGSHSRNRDHNERKKHSPKIRKL